MNRQKRMHVLHGHAVSGLFVFCLLCMFALLAATLTLVGINAYRSVNQVATSNSEHQIALSYLVNKLHAFDRAGGIFVMESDGMQVLCLRETFDDELYETRIFCTDGSLCEYFCAASEPFDVEMGMPLTQAAGLGIDVKTPNLVLIEVIREDGSLSGAHVALRSGEAVMP